MPVSDLFPPQVVVVEAVGAPVATPLPAAEYKAVSTSVDVRRLEFAATRACARRALDRLGIRDAVLPKDKWGSVSWPEGVIGSLTHCPERRAAAVAWSGCSGLTSLGLDLEVHCPLPPGVLALVALPEEEAQLRALKRLQPTVHWDSLLFSAKEAVYKAWHPICRTSLEFHDVSVTFDRAGAFTAEVIRDGRAAVSGGALIGGRWALVGSHIATGVTVGQASV